MIRLVVLASLATGMFLAGHNQLSQSSEGVRSERITHDPNMYVRVGEAAVPTRAGVVPAPPRIHVSQN